ncbi:MAG: hypothetical protein ACMUIP_17495 [bacterium]
MMSEKELRLTKKQLLHFGGGEIPLHYHVEVIRNDNVVTVVKEYAHKNDLVIFWVQRLGKGKRFLGISPWNLLAQLLA